MTTWASFQQRYTQLTNELRNRRFDMSRDANRENTSQQEAPLNSGSRGNINNSSISPNSPSDTSRNLSLNSTSSTSSSLSAPGFNLTPSPVSPANSSQVPSFNTNDRSQQQANNSSASKTENSSFTRSFIAGRLSLGKGSLGHRLNQFFFSNSPESPDKEVSPLNCEGGDFLRPTAAAEIINNHCLSPRPRPRPLGIGPNGPSSPRRPGPLGFPQLTRPFPNEFSMVASMQDALNTLLIDGKRIKVTENEFEKIEELGSGSCGHVEKMKHKPTGNYYAVKQMRISNNEDDSRMISRDLDVLLKCSDYRIVKCFGCLMMNNEVWVFMELMSSCFDKILKKHKSPLPEEIIGKVAVATVEALDYLKTEKIMHRDIKPSNILINEKGEIKLCDFGISGRLVDSKAKTKTAGCTAYLAPERIEPQDPQNHSYDVRADVWSLGLTLVEMSKGCFPYPPCTCDFQLMTLILSNPSPQPDPECFNEEFCDFCKICLEKNVKNRPKYNRLLQHPFIQMYKVKDVKVGEWFVETIVNRPD